MIHVPPLFVRSLRCLVCLGIVTAIATLPPLASADPPGREAVRLGRLQTRVAQLEQRVNALAGGEDLLDTLHFAWFDRPYARASLAVLVKEVSMLEREIHLRELGNGAIPDSTLDTMLTWAEKAVKRVGRPEPYPRFRPHRLRVTGASFDDPTWTPLFAYVDRSTVTRHHVPFGDLDLLAALGMRVYARPVNNRALAGTTELVRARVEALGMATVCVTARGNATPVFADPNAATAMIRSVSLSDLLQNPPNTGTDRCALKAHALGESWAAWLARRALARGEIGGPRYAVADWAPPVEAVGSQDGPTVLATAMWVDAIEGLSLGLLPGWRDLRDGSASPFPSALLNPARVETVARTALDILYVGPRCTEPFGARPALAMAVGPDAVHPRDDNAWAPWIKPVWEWLLDRQIRFDVVRDRAGAQPEREYAVMVSLRRDEAENPGSVQRRIEQALGSLREHAIRVTAREPDGSPAAGILVREGRTDDGKACIALVNLTNRQRRIGLCGGRRLGPLADLLAGQTLRRPSESVPLAPWQVRLLWPTE